MKEINEMPESGQFVAVWVYDQKTWGNTYKWQGGKIYRYDECADEFERDEFALNGFQENEARFFIS